MKKLVSIISIWGCLFMVVSTWAQDTDTQLYDQANSLYNQGDYQGAVTNYLQIIDHGQHSADLYYNLGNAYYKLNQIAASIYYYEKALLLRPEDPDVLNNLAYAQNMTIDAIEVMPTSAVDRLVSNVVGVFSSKVWAGASIVLMLGFVGFFLAYYFSQYHGQKRLYFVLSFLCLALCIGAFISGYKQQQLFQSNNAAIIFAKETAVTAEPNLGSETVFQLHEGTKVDVLEHMGDWRKIKLADGKLGWLPKEDLKQLKDF